MKKLFKKHFLDLKRYQTSQGRDLEKGLRLDRNERVSNFSVEVLADILKKFAPYSLSASPDAARLYQKIAKYLGVKTEMIYVTSGITEGIRMLYEALASPGDNVIVLDPTYPMYSVYAQLQRIEYRKFTYGKDLKPDWKTLEKNLDDKTKIMVIPNPNLPIESMFTVDEIRQLAERCQENGTVLVVDEAYYGFGDSPTCLELLKTFDNLVIMRTFSKAFGLAGIRLGYMISNPENIDYLSRTRSLVESNSLTMGVAEYFLDHPKLVEEHISQVRAGSKFIKGKLDALGIRWHGGEYTNGLLIFLKNEQASKDCVAYLKQRKIYIRGGFEAPYQSCVRISLGPQETMSIFLQYFTEWFNDRSNLTTINNQDSAISGKRSR